MHIGIARINETETTARYFESAAVAAGHQARRIGDLEGASLDDLDLLIVVDPFLKSAAVLRSALCPVAGYLIDVHQQLPVRLAYARYFDHVFVAQPDYLPAFVELGHASAHWLPLGCDPDVHFAAGRERIYDVGSSPTRSRMGLAAWARRAGISSLTARPTKQSK